MTDRKANMEPALFTPNVEAGDSSVRYRLYRRGPGLFSATPKGKRFRLQWEKDDCGLGCRCAGKITSISESGRSELERAEKIYDAVSDNDDEESE